MVFAIRLIALALLTALCATGAQAQVIFAAPVGGGTTGLFQANNGAVTPIVTGLPSHDFPALGLDNRLITFSSPDPAQPNEASTDLYAYDRQTGQARKLFDNVTQPQPDGSYLFASPIFSGTSADGTLTAFVNVLSSSNNQQQGGSYRQLKLLRSSDGFDLADIEYGNGNTFDFFASEFSGIAWLRNGPSFVSPAYMPVYSSAGRPTQTVGLVMFGVLPDGSFGRLGALTEPMVWDVAPNQIVVEEHVMPAVSPDNRAVAFFELVWPSVLLTEPVSANLVVIYPDEGTGFYVVQFNPGWYPLGVAWSADGNTLVFSLGQQTYQDGMFLPTGEPSTAQIMTVPVQGGPLGSVPGVSWGYFPSVVSSLPAGTIFRNGFE